MIDVASDAPLPESTNNSDASPEQPVDEVTTSGAVESEQSSGIVTNYIDGDDSVMGFFLDLVDMSQYTCCGYSYILQLVDQIACLGHVTLLKSSFTNYLLSGFNKLMSLS